MDKKKVWTRIIAGVALLLMLISSGATLLMVLFN